MNDPFFHLDDRFVGHGWTNYCQGCPQTRTGGFCGVRIQPECLRIASDGTVRVSLAPSAQVWFDAISRLGEVLHLTRNPVAVMGSLGQAPVLDEWQNPSLPRDRFGFFAPNLAEYASLWAVREHSPLGVLHGLEARDVSGTVFERVLLPSGARRDVFEQLVTEYQSPPEAAGHWFPANHAWSNRRRASLAGRIPWLRARWDSGDRQVRRLPVRCVAKLLSAAARMKLPLRTTSYHPAQMRTLLWTPRTCADTLRGDGLLDFFDGDGAGLHLSRNTVASVWLWAGRCSCCAETKWSVELADSRDQIGLAIQAGDRAGESEWRKLVKLCLP
jgi:hypothetical protein